LIHQSEASMADDRERDELMSETSSEIETMEADQLELYDHQRGARAFVENNRFIPASYNGTEWRLPLYASESFDTGTTFVGNPLDYLTGTDLAHLARKFNSWGKNEKGYRPFLKVGGSEIPDSLIRYFCQKAPETGMHTLLLVMQANKTTEGNRKGTGVNVFSIFHVRNHDKQIFTPEGLFHSMKPFGNVANETGIVFSKYQPMSKEDMSCFDGYKQLAQRFRTNPTTKITDEEHFRVFCLFHVMRSGDRKYSKAMFDLSAYATQLTKMKRFNNYTIMGGSFNELRVDYLSLLFSSPDAVNANSDRHQQTKAKFRVAYEKTFQHKKKRQCKKRKHADADQDDDDDDGSQNDNWKDDLQYYNLDIEKYKIEYVDVMWREYIAAKLERRTPKTIEDYLALYDDAPVLKQKRQTDLLREEALLIAAGVNADEAAKEVFTKAVSELKPHMDVVMRKAEGAQYVVDPLFSWACRHFDIGKEIMVKMILASLAMASNKIVPLAGPFSDEARYMAFSKFVKPRNQLRCLANTEKGEVVTNIMLVEKAMDTYINTAVHGSSRGKEIAIIIATQYKEMYKAINILLDQHYEVLQKWVKETLLEILDDDDDDDAPDLEFGTYYLPAFLCGMVLYISRKMYVLCENNGWFNWPSNVKHADGERLKFKKPTKSNDLLLIEEEFESFQHFHAAFRQIHDLKDLTEEIIEEGIKSQMIVSQRKHVGLPHISGNNCAPIMIHICKVVTNTGRFGYKLIKPRFPFSMYPIFSECDPRTTLYPRKGIASALDDIPVLAMMHQVIVEIMNDFKITTPKVYDQVPVKQNLVLVEGQGQAVWKDVNDTWDELTDEENVIDIDGFSLAVIQSVTMDIAITTYLAFAGAISSPYLVSFHQVDTESVSQWEDALRRRVDRRTLEGVIKTRLVATFEHTGIAVMNYSKLFRNETLIGRSIVDNKLRGIVFMGSIDTMLCMKSKVGEKFKHLGQMESLSNTFFVGADKKDRVQNMFSENIIFNPRIEDVENLEPMSVAAWAETEKFLALKVAGPAAAAPAVGAKSGPA